MLQNFALEHPHPAGAVCDLLASQDRKQAGEEEIADPAGERHLAVFAGHARADYEVRPIERRLAQLGEILGRVRSVGIQKTD